MSSDTDILEADSVATDSVTSNDGYLRLGVPEASSDDTGESTDTTGITGSYIRLGSYTSVESDYLPQNVGLSASATEASGLFLKTNGVLAVSIDGNAYEQFAGDHVNRIEGDLAITTLGASTRTAESVEIYANAGVNGDNTTENPGTLTLKGSSEVYLTAENNNITLETAEDYTSTTGGDHIEYRKNKWESKAYGEAYTYFSGVFIQFYTGLQISLYGSLVAGAYATYITWTGILDFHVCSIVGLDFGFFNRNISVLNVSMVNTEIKNKEVVYSGSTFLIDDANIVSQNVDMSLDQRTMYLKSGDVSADTSRIVRIFL